MPDLASGPDPSPRSSVNFDNINPRQHAFSFWLVAHLVPRAALVI